MKQQALSSFDMPWLPITALIIFVVCFSLYTWWTFRKDRAPQYVQMSQIPLKDGEEIKESV